MPVLAGFGHGGNAAERLFLGRFLMPDPLVQDPASTQNYRQLRTFGEYKYFHSADNEESINLYFADESKNILYLDIDTAVSLLERVNHEIIEDKDYALTVSEIYNN